MPLAEQDRTLLGPGHASARASRLVERALPTGPVGPFQLQAAIAAVHAEAARAEDTDWAQIEVLYRMLRDLAPGPVVVLNHAVAVAMVAGPQAGLDLLGPLAEDAQLKRQHRLHAVRAHCSTWTAVDRGPERLRKGGSAGHEHPRTALPQRQGAGGMTDSGVDLNLG